MARTTSKKKPASALPLRLAKTPHFPSRVTPAAERDAQIAASILRVLDVKVRRAVVNALQMDRLKYSLTPVSAPAEIPGLLSRRAIALLQAVPPHHMGMVLLVAMSFAEPKEHYMNKAGTRYRSERPYLLPHQAAAEARYRQDTLNRQIARIDREVARIERETTVGEKDTRKARRQKGA